MDDETWRKCEGAWDRLQWAREQRYPGATKKAVAGTLGVKPGTYNAYERPPGSSKWIPLGHEHAFHFAKKLKVRWEWLLKGDGPPWPSDAPATGKDRARKALDNATDEQADVVADMLERLFKTGTGR